MNRQAQGQAPGGLPAGPLCTNQPLAMWQAAGEGSIDLGIPEPGTPVLSHDGRDLAAALQTIREIGDAPQLNQAVADAFPGASIDIGRVGHAFTVEFHQHGLLRPLSVVKPLTVVRVNFVVLRVVTTARGA